MSGGSEGHRQIQPKGSQRLPQRAFVSVELSTTVSHILQRYEGEGRLFTAGFAIGVLYQQELLCANADFAIVVNVLSVHLAHGPKR